MLPKHLQPETCAPIKTGVRVKDPTANQAINNADDAVKRCNLDCFATGKCTCQPQPDMTTAPTANAQQH